MSDTCLNCNGLIMKPGISYGYAGPTCHCPVNPAQQYQRPASKEQKEMTIGLSEMKDTDDTKKPRELVFTVFATEMGFEIVYDMHESHFYDGKKLITDKQHFIEKAAFEQAKAQLANAKSAYEALTNDNLSLKKERDAANENANNVANENLNLSGMNYHHIQEIEELATERDSEQSERVKLEELNNALKAELINEKNYSAETHARFEQLNDKISSLEAELERQKEDNKALLFMTQKGFHEIDEADKRIEALQSQADAMAALLATRYTNGIGPMDTAKDAEIDSVLTAYKAFKEGK